MTGDWRISAAGELVTEALRLRALLAASELRVDTKTKASAAWEGLYNERARMLRDYEARVDAANMILADNGCDCDCDHHRDECDDDCGPPCLACKIGLALTDVGRGRAS